MAQQVNAQPGNVVVEIEGHFGGDAKFDLVHDECLVVSVGEKKEGIYTKGDDNVFRHDPPDRN